MARDGGWRDQSACRTGLVDPEVFFPVGSEHTRAYRRQAEQAKEICRGCPVLAQCFWWALDEPDGISGGMTPEERTAERAKIGLGPAQLHRVEPRFVRPHSQSELNAQGQRAIRHGRSVRDAASMFGVTLRCAERWAKNVRDEQLEGAR